MTIARDTRSTQERADAATLRDHESRMTRIMADTRRLADALRDYTDPQARLLDLAAICQTASSGDHAEAGRQLAKLAEYAAHECARYELGDDEREAVCPAEILRDNDNAVRVGKRVADALSQAIFGSAK